MFSDTTKQGNSSIQAAWFLSLAPRWYIRDHPRRIIGQYLLYAQAFRESFSILFLLKTLFAPWKSIKDSYPQKGFNARAILETFFLNATTRCIGAVVRLCAIIAGLLLQLMLLAGFVTYLVWWMLFPLVAALLPFYLIITFFV